MKEELKKVIGQMEEQHKGLNEGMDDLRTRKKHLKASLKEVEDKLKLCRRVKNEIVCDLVEGKQRLKILGEAQ